MNIEGNTESATPAAVLARELPFEFERGQLVTHRDQPMLAMVMTRQRASNGLEFYGVTRLADDCEVPDLIIMGDVLVAVADEDAEAVAEAEEALSA